ncbi:MAG: ABC transporter transmembrane domain-containing protein [Flavobacteriaceae bacterium]
MITSDLMKMLVVLLFMFYMNWQLSWIVVLAMPVLVFFTRIFQRKMQVAFEKLRNQIANMNAFVQRTRDRHEIVRLFHREAIRRRVQRDQ